MSVKFENYFVTPDGQEGAGGSYAWAQTFMAESNHSVSSVKVKLTKDGICDTLTVSIRATDVNGYPTGSDLCSGSIDVSAIPTYPSFGEYEVSMSVPYSLVEGTKYCIVFRHNAGRHCFVGAKEPGAYSDGKMYLSPSPYDGSIWTVPGLYEAQDFCFEIWGVAGAVFNKGSMFAVL